MQSCRVACVKYLNTVPLIQGLEKMAGVELIPTVPSRIAGMVRDGEADLGLISVVDAARPGSGLILIPVGMIGCDGPTMTVRVFSSVPFEKVTTVAADTDSHTSVMLCRVILERVYGVRARFVDFDARERVVLGDEAGGDGPSLALRALNEAWPETVLLIGDKVVTDAPPAERYPHQLDLGEAWKGLTGLPFIYAVWACREDRAEEPVIVSGAAILDRQRRRNAMRLDWIAATEAPEHRWPVELAREYLGRRLRFEVREREREAVAKFSELAGLERPRWLEAAPADVQSGVAGVG